MEKLFDKPNTKQKGYSLRTGVVLGECSHKSQRFNSEISSSEVEVYFNPLHAPKSTCLSDGIVGSVHDDRFRPGGKCCR